MRSCTCATSGCHGHGHQRAGNRHAGTIRVAVGEPQAGGLDGAAFDVEREHRAGQRHAAREHAARCRRDRCACRAPPCSGRSRTRRRTAPRDGRPGSARVRCSAAPVIRSRGVYYFRRQFGAGRGSICPRELGPANGRIGQIRACAAPCRACIGLSRSPLSCGLMAALGPVAGAIP